ALLLLYDVTNKASFSNIQAWLTEIHEYAQKDVVVMLIGNKADSSQERVVKREEGEKLAKEFGVPFMESSARSGLNVELAFTAIAKELKHRSMKDPDEPKFQLQEYVNKEMRTGGCCRTNDDDGHPPPPSRALEGSLWVSDTIPLCNTQPLSSTPQSTNEQEHRSHIQQTY
ncbi:hypothetical protein AALO_G00087640, partial [Alosa alosa]